MSDEVQTPTPPATPPVSWTASLDADTQTYVQTKGFKEPKDVIESYRNFEKLQGVPKERLLQLPESLEGDAMNPIWERLGAVKEAKEYKIEIPTEHGDDKFGEWTKEAFHKLKVPRAMAEGFANAFNERQAAILKADKEAFQQQVATEQASIKKEWGAAFEQNERIANQAATKFGLSKEEVTSLGVALGPAKAMKFLHKLGEGIGEAAFVDGNGARPGVYTPSQAQSEIKALIKDVDFARRLQAGDVDAKNKWNRLHQSAYQGEITT